MAVIQSFFFSSENHRLSSVIDDGIGSLWSPLLQARLRQLPAPHRTPGSLRSRSTHTQRESVKIPDSEAADTTEANVHSEKH